MQQKRRKSLGRILLSFGLVRVCRLPCLWKKNEEKEKKRKKKIERGKEGVEERE